MDDDAEVIGEYWANHEGCWRNGESLCIDRPSIHWHCGWHGTRKTSTDADRVYICR